MRTKNITTERFHARKVKKYGDLAIWWGIQNSNIWEMFIYRSNKVFLEVLKTYFRFSTAMLAYSVSAILRFRFGFQTTGGVMSIATTSMLIGFNSNHIWIIFKPFMVFINPFIPFFIKYEQLYSFICVDIHSNTLLFFTLIFTIMTIIHTFMIYFKKGNVDATKRGESWLYLLLSKVILLNETLVSMILEPLLIIFTGFAFWKWGHDAWAGIYFCLAGFSVFAQQMQDESQRAHNRTAIGL